MTVQEMVFVGTALVPVYLAGRVLIVVILTTRRPSTVPCRARISARKTVMPNTAKVSLRAENVTSLALLIASETAQIR